MRCAEMISMMLGFTFVACQKMEISLALKEEEEAMLIFMLQNSEHMKAYL